MRALYEIDQAILDCVDEETGEIIDPERLDALQMEREQKLEGVALWIKDTTYEAQMVKEEADKLSARRKALENRVTSLKAWLVKALEGRKLNTPRCKVYQTHSQRVAIVGDEKDLIAWLERNAEDPRDYIRYKEPELRKDKIKDALKDGKEIEYAKLEETESVVIK
jgi:hypothetical protein